ncbi:MAG: alginate export family protein [Pseudomonadota bacterium]
MNSAISRVLPGIGLVALFSWPIAAGAQTQPGTPTLENATILVIAQTDQLSPRALPSTPPSEATQDRAPANHSTRAYPPQADGHGVKLGGYNKSRWAEDWRKMRDPANRHDWIDRLKFLPLDAAGDIYVTLSGEMRLRSDFYANPGLVEAPSRREDLLRLMGGADLHLGPNVRFYGELAHGGIGGDNIGTPAAKSRNALFVQQAFGEVSGTIGPVVLGARYGRQEFTDGPSLLVSQKDNNTIRSALNGFRGWVQTDRVRADIFDFRYTQLGTGGTGDDRSDPATSFSGITAGVVLASHKGRKLYLDPFAWRERMDAVRWGKTTARSVRHFYGARLWGDVGRLTLDWTVDRQDGDFGGRDISAWHFSLAQTYALKVHALSPEIGIHFDYGSGGGSYDGGTIRGATAPVAGTISYSYQSVLNITNLFQIGPNVTIAPIKNISVTTEYLLGWRASAADAVYRGNGSAYAGTEKLSGSHVGDSLRAQATWKITPRLSLIGRYEYFMAGSLLSRVNYTDSQYLAGWVSYRF